MQVSRVTMAILQAMCGVAMASQACAHTQEWYADHLGDAKAMQAQCIKRLKADEQLSQHAMDECHRASGAVFHSGRFTPSKPKSW